MQLTRRAGIVLVLGACATGIRALPTDVVVAPHSSASAFVLTAAAPEDAAVRPRYAPVETILGNTTLFDAGSSHAPDLLLGSPLVVPHGGRLASLGVIGVVAGPMMVLALYTDDAGAPGTLVGWTRATALDATDMRVPVEVEVELRPGTYWIMGAFDANASIGIDYSDGDAAVAYTSQTVTAPLPSRFPVPQTYTGQRFNYYIVLR